MRIETYLYFLFNTWGHENVLIVLDALLLKVSLICPLQCVAKNSGTTIYISPSYDSTKFGIWGRKQIIILI